MSRKRIVARDRHFERARHAWIGEVTNDARLSAMARVIGPMIARDYLNRRTFEASL